MKVGQVKKKELNKANDDGNGVQTRYRDEHPVKY